jgi:excisionase family DNA binding protein
MTRQEILSRREVTVREAAIRKQVAEVTIRRWIATSVLPAHRCGPRLIRIYTDDLDKIGAPIGGAA